MQFRITKVDGFYELEACFPRSWLWKVLFGEPEWYWIHSYSDLDSAKRGRDYLVGGMDKDREVVG